MTDPNAFQVNLLLGELQKVLRTDPGHVPALCQIGAELGRLGRTQEARKPYRAAVDALRRAARAGDVDRALDWENLIFTSFVQPVENEQHYYRCFADWKDDLAALGRRFRDPGALASGNASGIAFFLHTGYVLGHTEMLLKMLELRPRGAESGSGSRCCIYVFGPYSAAFLERCRAVEVEVVPVIDALGEDAPWNKKLLWLRDRFRRDGIGVCIWVTYPVMAAFALSMRLAPVQIFWAMRFHPISAPYIDGYITWGDSKEQSRRYGSQDWQVVPLPFALDDSPPERAEVENLRRRFPEQVLLGTLAREDKINSTPFLQAMVEILTANPQAGFLWTGHDEHPAVSNAFRAAGVADRCHFAGWVDTKLHAAALDIFLDTFPHGCGITSYQAFAAGTPLLSYLGPYTIFGTHFWQAAREAADDRSAAAAQPRLSAPDEHPILCARDEAEYVNLAGRLIGDPAWRKHIGDRGRAFFQEELDNNGIYAGRFFETVRRIAASKLGQPGPQSAGLGSPA